MSKVIERDDLQEVRRLAKKYNMSVADFGRSVVRQAERNETRTVRLSEVEYNYIVQTAKRNGVSVGRFCALACHAFLTSETRDTLPRERAEDGGMRTKRIAARFDNVAEEAEIIRIATEYSMKVSALIRYCALKFDGEKINLEKEEDHEL